MMSTPLRALAAFALPAAFFAVGTAHCQGRPDRPPWAQKTKADSKTSSTGATATPGAIVPTPTQPVSDPQDGAAQRGQIKVKVDLVSILASVLDDRNRPAPDLPVEAFQIYEEGVRQKIEVFESETKLPLDLALMIDSSLSANMEIGFEKEAAAHFIRQVLRPGDRLSVFDFDENVTQLAGFSDNIPALQSAVRKIPPGSGTSIYDAILLGAQALERRGENRRRVIVLITDGGETTSHTDFDATRKEAVRSGALLYTIVIRAVKNESGRNTAGEHALETITETTGGDMFYPDAPRELDVIFDLIDRELRTQYRLGYYPNPRGPANTYRNIEVKVLNGEYHVRSRKMYLTGPQ
jgi:Ca-activated chloride channel homolog